FSKPVHAFRYGAGIVRVEHQPHTKPLGNVSRFRKIGHEQWQSRSKIFEHFVGQGVIKVLAKVRKGPYPRISTACGGDYIARGDWVRQNEAAVYTCCLSNAPVLRAE